MIVTGDYLVYLRNLLQALVKTEQITVAQYNLCAMVVNDDRWQTAPASTDKHHNYPGGLMVHTAEVVRAVHQICLRETPPTLDLAVLICAAIWHDAAKIGCYEKSATGQYVKTDYYSKIGHLPGSYGEWIGVAAGEVPDKFLHAVGHCILSHHGRREWRSACEPETPEAWWLHAADYWSAKWGPGKSIGG